MLFCRCGCVTKLCSLCLAGSLETKLKSVNFIQVSIQFYNFILRFQDVRPFFGVLLLRFGHESGCCFAVADASQSHAACAWHARWPQNGKVNFINFIVGFQK